VLRFFKTRADIDATWSVLLNNAHFAHTSGTHVRLDLAARLTGGINLLCGTSLTVSSQLRIGEKQNPRQYEPPVVRTSSATKSRIENP
jgi:hypothetical protein